MTLDQFLADPTKLGMIGLLSLAVLAFMRGWVVTGPQYEAMRKERDEFKEMVVRAADTADRALKVAQKSTAG